MDYRIAAKEKVIDGDIVYKLFTEKIDGVYHLVVKPPTPPWWITGTACTVNEPKKPYTGCEKVQQNDPPPNTVSPRLRIEAEADYWILLHDGNCEEPEEGETVQWWVTGYDLRDIEETVDDYCGSNIVASDHRPGLYLAGPWSDYGDAEAWITANDGSCGDLWLSSVPEEPPENWPPEVGDVLKSVYYLYNNTVSILDGAVCSSSFKLTDNSGDAIVPIRGSDSRLINTPVLVEKDSEFETSYIWVSDEQYFAQLRKWEKNEENEDPSYHWAFELSANQYTPNKNIIKYDDKLYLTDVSGITEGMAVEDLNFTFPPGTVITHIEDTGDINRHVVLNNTARYDFDLGLPEEGEEIDPDRLIPVIIDTPKNDNPEDPDYVEKSWYMINRKPLIVRLADFTEWSVDIVGSNRRAGYYPVGLWIIDTSLSPTSEIDIIIKQGLLITES